MYLCYANANANKNYQDKEEFKHTTLNIHNVTIPLMIHIFMSRSTEHAELVI
jgi:hypothetical protein